MTKIIRDTVELEALPLGTQVVDSDGDTLRRTELGWSYRQPGQPVTLHDINPSRTLGPYLPMVVLSPEPSPLDAPGLAPAIAAYLEGRFPGHADHLPAANTIIKLIKEHKP